MNIFKKLFCRHEYSMIYNKKISDIDNNGFISMMIISKCNKCGKLNETTIYISKKEYDKLRFDGYVNEISNADFRNEIIRRLNKLDRYTNPKYSDDSEFYVVDEVYDLIDDVFGGIPEDTGSIELYEKEN